MDYCKVKDFISISSDIRRKNIIFAGMESKINEYKWILDNKPLYYDDKQFNELLNEDDGVRKMLAVIDRRLYHNGLSLRRLDGWRFETNAAFLKAKKDIKLCRILLILQGIAIILLNIAFLIYII